MSAIFQIQAPGGLYLEGRFNGGVFAFPFWGLIFEGAYFRNFTVGHFRVAQSLFQEGMNRVIFYFHEDKTHFNKKGLTLCLVLKATVFELVDGRFAITYKIQFMLFSGFLRRYIHTSNLRLRLECCLLSATFFKVLLTFWISY